MQKFNSSKIKATKETILKNQTINIGLTAGASAPETLVQILISKLKKKFGVNLINHEVVKEDIIFNLPKSLR